MSKTAEPRRQKSATIRVPLAMSAELDADIDAAAREVGLSKQDTMRLSIERGLKVLKAQMTSQPTAA